jgi:glycosyltransferase involved in cell wall biosynthesis
LYRWRQWPLFWAFRHPPDGWIAVQDGTGGAAVVHRFSPIRIPVLEVWNARPDVAPTSPPSAPPWRWLFAGTLDRLKGADRLVKILQHVAGQGTLPLEFWVAGEGPYAEVVARIAGVRYLGRLSWSRMQAVYPRIHGVLVLNRYANLTLPLVEGLAHGRPVLGMEESGESRVLGREEGVVWVRSLDALVQHLRTLTQEETYRSLQLSTARGARRFPSWEEVAAREVAWIQTQLGEKG